MRLHRAALLLLLLPTFVIADQVGMRSFLVDPGVAASGMGNAYSAVAEDPSALFWNLGGLTQGRKGWDFLFVHTEWFLDLRQEYAVAVLRRERDAFAIGVDGFYLDDIERRDDVPTAEPLGTFGYSDLVVPVAYSRAFGPVSGGLALKPWYSKIERESAHGIAMDLGAMYRTPLEGMRLAATLTNIGSSNEFTGNAPFFKSETFSLPLEFRLGASYRFPLSEQFKLLLAGQYRAIRSQSGKGDFGAELELHRDFLVRFGYKAGYDIESWSFGFAARWQNLSVQYAAVPLDSDFGTSHRIGIGYTQ